MSVQPGLHLHFDCASGIAGDMTLGALIDAGVPRAVVEQAFAAVGLGAERLRVERINKRGIAACNVTIATDAPLSTFVPAPRRALVQTAPTEHEHAHHRFADIRARIQAAPLAEAVSRRALAIFTLLAEAEATLHGTTVDDVALHEVGAIDAIADIVGTAAALEYLAPRKITASAVAMGEGTLTCAHGILPVPAPAALEIMRRAGARVTGGGLARELCTPTGAAILGASVTEWSGIPTGTPIAIGWGAGDADLPDRANVVRATLLDTGAAPPPVWQIETNIDDMNPQLGAVVIERALAAGALDVWLAPVVMKKSRAAMVLAALVREPERAAVIEVIVRETTAIGVRMTRVDRVELARAHVNVETPWGAVRVKVARDGARIVNASPEFDDCVRVASAAERPVKEVLTAAMVAYARAATTGDD